jgi:hypothetical protein
MRTDEMIELGSNSELCAGFSCGSGSEMTCGREINATSKFHSANNAKNAAKVGSHACCRNVLCHALPTGTRERRGCAGPAA